MKLSNELVLDARMAGEIAERSLAGQIEFWAGLGRAIEPILRLPDVLALRSAGATKTLSACLAGAGTPAGSRRVAKYLNTRPFPHYETARSAPGFLVRVDEDGARTVGRFVNRRFVEARRKHASK